MARRDVRWLPRGRRGYWTAAVCSSGHVAVSAAYDPCWLGPEVPQHCGQCGADVLTKCPECDRPIHGRGRRSPAPNFCTECRTAFPWAAEPTATTSPSGPSDPAAKQPSTPSAAASRSGAQFTLLNFSPSMSISNSQVAVASSATQTQTQAPDAESKAPASKWISWVGPIVGILGSLFKTTPSS